MLRCASFMLFIIIMTQYKDNLLNLHTATPQSAAAGGGKFAGLAAVKPLVDKYVAEYNVQLTIPETYAIKIGTPRAQALDAAMYAMDACGGTVAVRSSADVEDASGKTYSGAFESVLNVSGRDKMQDALAQVYDSANCVPGAKMGVVIQRMISAPDMAGVLYSMDFNGDPYNVINYTIGRPSDLLLTNRERGNISKMGKYFRDTNGKLKAFCFSDITPTDADSLEYQVSFDKMLQMLPLARYKEYCTAYSLMALANHLEYDLGYPVDVEFAIDCGGTINVLQQRPYIMNCNYVVRRLRNGDFVGYNRHNPVIRGTVKVVDVITQTPAQYEQFINDARGKILLSKDHTNNNDGYQLLLVPDLFQNQTQALLKIDAQYALHYELYSHRGNYFRERGTPFLSTMRTPEFADVADGDIMEIDMRTAQFKIAPQKTR